MKILYIGACRGTSGHRAAALARLGHHVLQIDPMQFLPASRPVAYWMKYLGSIGAASYVSRRLARAVGSREFDATWVDHGELISPDCVRMLKTRASVAICYNLDDPFGRRDRSLWFQYRRAVREYDLVVVVREPNIAEAYAAGAKRVKHVFRAADEVAHRRPASLEQPESSRVGSDVLFIGTAFPERGSFMAELLRRRLPLAIYGNRWQRLKEWPLLKQVWRGPGISDDDHYARAIAGAKVCLGLLSKENRDLHTQRSMEIPSLGGALCAERTSEHESLYTGGKEALFWSDPAECAARCEELLTNERLRRSIACAGHARFLANGWTNERVAREVLSDALRPAARRASSNGVLSKDDRHYQSCVLR